MKVDLIDTFKITNGISNNGRHFFNISSLTGDLLWRQKIKFDFRRNGLEKNLRGHFWELSDELLKNLFCYIDIVLIAYIFCAKFIYLFTKNNHSYLIKYYQLDFR